MENRSTVENSNNRLFYEVIVSLIVTIIGGIIVAWFIGEGARFQDETGVISTATSNVSEDSLYPNFTIVNRLALAVDVIIDDVHKGVVKSHSAEKFIIDNYPVDVKWVTIKQRTSVGSRIGEEMQGVFIGVGPREVVTITNLVNGHFFFYPILSNHTTIDCEPVINRGMEVGEIRPGVLIEAGQENIGLGYYTLYSNSNVTLICGDISYRWGSVPSDIEDDSFIGLVDDYTGITRLVLYP